MTFSQRVLTVTQDEIVPKVVDNILSDNFLTFRFISNGNRWNGETMKFPVKVSKNTNGGSFSGMDTLANATVDTRVMLSYDPRGFYMNATVSGMERAVNATDAQVLNLVTTTLNEAALDAFDLIGTMVYADGTGNTSKDFYGLDYLADDTTTSSTVGTISKTTYPSLAGTRTASGGTITAAKISTLLTNTGAGNAARQQVSMLLSNETVWDFGEAVIATLLRGNYDATGYPITSRRSKAPIKGGQLAGVMGYTTLIYRGTPWIKDEKSTSQTLWAINENYTRWYGLKSPSLKSVDMGSSNVEGPYSEAPTENTGFQWSDFMNPINQFSEVAYFFLLGNMVTDQPRRNGRLTGITGT